MPTTTPTFIRTSLRTPGILIFGMVFAPCGWIFNLTSTVAPNWRTINNIPGQSSDMVLEQGIWDICQTFISSQTVTCNQPDTVYFSNRIIPVAQGLMIASLLVTLIGLCVAIPGVRCWKDNPNWLIAGLGGILIFISGVLALIPISWYTNILTSIPASSTDIRVGYSIVLGYIGGIMEVLGGFVMFIGICRCCDGRNRGEKPVTEIRSDPETFQHSRPPRRVEVPSISRTRSNASSVPYSKDSLDDADFPRAKPYGNRSVNTSYSGRPYDADL